VDVEAKLASGVVAADVPSPPVSDTPTTVKSGKKPKKKPSGNYQAWTMGVLGGVNVCTYLGDDIPSGAEPLVGWAVGPTFNVHLGKGFFAQVEMLYSRKGAKQGFDFSDGDSGFDDVSPKELFMDYVELPLYIKWFTSTSLIQWYLSFGGYVSFLVHHTDLFDKRFLEDVDGGLILGGGMAFGTPPGTFFVDLRYDLGLAKVFDLPDGSDDVKLGSLGLYFGFQF